MSTDELRRLVLGVFATDDVTRKWFVDIGSASPGPGQRMVNLLDCEGLVSISSMLKSYRYVTSANVFLERRRASAVNKDSVTLLCRFSIKADSLELAFRLWGYLPQ